MARYGMGRAMCVAAAAVLAGCASQAYDPKPSADRVLEQRVLASAMSVEDAYRMLNAQLTRCIGAGYHVQPRFERDTGRAWVMLVRGLGLDRYSFLGNRFEARFDIEPVSGGSRVRVTSGDPRLDPVVAAAQRWLSGGSLECPG